MSTGEKTSSPTNEPLEEIVLVKKETKEEKKRSRSKDNFQEEIDSQELLKRIEHGYEKEGISVLMSACQQGLEHEVRDILRRRPKMLYFKDRTGKNAIHYCAENQNITCIEQIISKDHDLVNLKDNDGYTALQLSVMTGNIPMIKFLLSHKASIHTLDNDQLSLMHWAVVCGKVEVLDVLFMAGAKPSLPDKHGAHPIHYAAQLSNSTDNSRKNIYLNIYFQLSLKGHIINECILLKYVGTF